MPDESVQCCITSPPYWGLRDYGHDGQLGLESTPEEYVSRMVEVFRDVRRVLRDDGTLWLNLGDSYTANERGKSSTMGARSATFHGQSKPFHPSKPFRLDHGLKPKDLVGIPWRVAFALQADGWYLRSDIIWAKPNPMPESVTDRPTKAHEYVFLLSKSAKYFYDADAVRESAKPESADRYNYKFGGPKANQLTAEEANGPGSRTHPIGSRDSNGSRNRRTVWNIATRPFPGAHFAVFPPDLVIPMVDAGTSEKGCCSLCGAGWWRVVKSHQVDNEKIQTARALGGVPGLAHGTPHERVRRLDGKNYEHARRPTGQWQPGCDCEAPEDESGILIEIPDDYCDRYVYHPEPCTVLDPFAGSGTTGIVAVERGRSFIGLELNPEYAAMATERLTQASRQGRLDFGEPVKKPEQMELP